MAFPPAAWTFRMDAPSRVSARAAPGHGVGNVVQFQVHKQGDVFLPEFAHGLRPGAVVKLHPHFKTAGVRSQLFRQENCFSHRVDVQPGDSAS